jgi:hypothetical protein
MMKPDRLPRQARDKQQRNETNAERKRNIEQKGKAFFLRDFPMFVPSLSWENDCFLAQSGSKRRFFLF